MKRRLLLIPSIIGLLMMSSLSKFTVLIAIGAAPSIVIAQSYTFALGRLFLTPEQRRLLDAEPKKADRANLSANANGNGNGNGNGTGAGAGAAAQATGDGYGTRLDGWLHRSEGLDTIWLNSQPVLVPANGAAAANGSPQLQGGQVVIRDAQGIRRRLVPGPQFEFVESTDRTRRGQQAVPARVIGTEP